MLLALAALTVVASQKPGVPPAPSRVPEQIHTAVAGQSSTSGDATGFSVMWFTSERTDSVVRFSTSPDLDSAAPVEVRGTSESYLEDWGYHHTVEVLGLRPSVVYYYAVGDGASTWSATQRYRMTPGAASTEPFNMSIFGDMGYLGSEERPMVITIVGLKKHWSAVPTRRRLEHMHSAGELDAIWHVGDIGYIDDSFAHEGGQLHFVYEQAYNGYMSWLQNLTATMPYMVSPGNHESECHIDQCLLQSEKYGKKLNNFTAFNKRWHMPSATSGGALNMWYSFNYGPVHFVSLNSETDFPSAEERSHGDASSFPAGNFGRKGEYLEWLEADLKAAAANRAQRPWIIAGGHRPCCSDIPGAAALFEKYGVAAYFAGHSHSYFRSPPTYANMTVPHGLPSIPRETVFNPHSAATTYITAGGAGCDEMTWVNKTHADPDKDCDAQGVCLRRRPGAPVREGDGNPKQVVKSSRLISGVLTVVSGKELRYKAIASTDGGVIDELVITQP